MPTTALENLRYECLRREDVCVAIDTLEKIPSGRRKGFANPRDYTG